MKVSTTRNQNFDTDGRRGLRSFSPLLIALAGVMAVALAPRPAAGATIAVTTNVQKVSGSPGCSLQEAIFAANFDASQAISPAATDLTSFIATNCTAGNGDDTIELDGSQTYQMFNVINDPLNQLGPTATPLVFTNITINANGATLELPGGSPNMRLFAVADLSNTIIVNGNTIPAGTKGHLTINNANIRNFRARGGNGARGGGGGMGAGGAIYLKDGGLTVENCAFEGNNATGGNGSANPASAVAGGGGGLGGNGGSPGGTGSLAGGGGGGGARGNGGNGGDNVNCGGSGCEGGGGGGGGTVTSGQNAPAGIGFGSGGFNCGGTGAHSGTLLGGEDGEDGSCQGGGGGGGASRRESFPSAGEGGKGQYGGGGGGGGYSDSDGGDGGFGGGGGSGTTFESNLTGVGPGGGNGGFGGGGGAAHGGFITGGPGSAGAFGGGADHNNGGGGAGLGGAIFNDSGTVVIRNCTLTGNSVTRGLRGGTGGTADNGNDAGGAIFSRNGSLTVLNATIAGNESTGSAAAIQVYNDDSASFTLRNTIIANNIPDLPDHFHCIVGLDTTRAGSGNLIQRNFQCPQSVTDADPQLGPLQLNAPGNTKTMAIPATSPAVDKADAATSLATDQRGVPRPIGGGFDIGAFEAPLDADLQISKSAAPPVVSQGANVTYTLIAKNNGPSAADSVVVTDTLPSAVTFVSCASTGGGVCGGSGSDRTVSFTSLASGAEETITLVGTVNCSTADGASVSNTATIASPTPDHDPDNNSATATFTGSNPITLSPANVWIGLKNSDDVGTHFDLLAEVFRNGVLFGSGQVNNVPGGSSGFNNAVLRSINQALSSPTTATLCAGDTVSIRLSARIGVTGHRSGTARLWYNDAQANSRFAVAVNGSTTTLYLRAGSTLATSAGAGPRLTSDVFVDRLVGGNPFKPFGTWSTIF